MIFKPGKTLHRTQQFYEVVRACLGRYICDVQAKYELEEAPIGSHKSPARLSHASVPPGQAGTLQPVESGLMPVLPVQSLSQA